MSKVPDYYKGRITGLQVQQVLTEFGLLERHNLASATEYILRSGNKHETPVEDLRKAIHHIELYIEYYEQRNKGQ